MNKRFLVVCNAYPSKDAIYRNGFIHRRVKAYQQKGLTVDVFYLHVNATEVEVYQYDGVNVTFGNELHYKQFLLDNQHIYQTFLIHFINPHMYYPIIETIKNPKFVIWIHGFEAEAWHRRWFNFLSSAAELKQILDKAEDYYPTQLEFMNQLYKETNYDITFIHVSEWFKTHIADVDAKFSPLNYEIIPNIVDSNVFNYVKKERKGKLKVLSIRPFASYKYANDQTADAIHLLSKKPFFNDLEFHIYGEGKLYNTITDSLIKYDNVKLHNTFLEQKDIAKIHKQFDVFLCPTRLDSQGVSMCEAMSSGLVVVSSNVTAIPEFVTHNETGLLADKESPASLAYQIERLYFNDVLFNKISAQAAQSIRDIASESVVIEKELKVILND
ncbi:glycosyltransferase family 4 protein [Macrococcus capreoli]|uniref:glycosyltransferase family 4 protein n=1 Tax=Macrococcus capreoli TaxID=2982690 RepID=UPI003F444D3E